METTDDYYLDVLEKTTLAKESKRLYRENLEWMEKILAHYKQKDDKEIKNIYWILQHPQEIEATFCQGLNPKTNEKFAIQTQSSFFTTIMSLYKHVPDIKVIFKKHHKAYSKINSEIKEEVQKRYDAGKITEKQENGWVDWVDIIKKRKELSETEYGSKRHLLVSMYTYIPPLRQDFQFIKILEKPPLGKEAKTENYLVLYKRAPALLVINQYKTAKTYDPIEKRLPEPLTDIIKFSLKQHPRQYLFVDSHGKPYEDKKRYRENVNDTLKYIFGVPLTPTLIRHAATIHEESIEGITPGDTRKFAHEMRHSLSVHEDYKVSRKEARKKLDVKDANYDFFSA